MNSRRFKSGDWVIATNPTSYGPHHFCGVINKASNEHGEVDIITRSRHLKSQLLCLEFPEDRVFPLRSNLCENAITPHLLLDLCFTLKERVEDLEEAVAIANDRVTELTEEKNQ